MSLMSDETHWVWMPDPNVRAQVTWGILELETCMTCSKELEQNSGIVK
jgi:hypothetical protein